MASNRTFNLLSPTARTGVADTRLVDNLNNPSGHFIVHIDALSTDQYLTLQVIGLGESGIDYDADGDGTPNDRAQYIIFQSNPINQETSYRFVMGPTFECVPGISCRDFLPKRFFMRITPNLPAQTDTYSVDLNLGLG